MTSAQSTTLDPQQRFEHLLISEPVVCQLMGIQAPGEVTYAESEQGNARRSLLNVEKLAIKNKVKTARSNAGYLDKIQQQLYHAIAKQMKLQIKHSEVVFNQVAGLTNEVGVMLDTLASPSCSVSRLESPAAALPWLFDDLIKLVNEPQNRRRDAKGNIIVVESLRTALSFAGVENLKKLFPAFVVKRTLPQITDPFPAIKHQLWKYTILAGNTAAILGPQYQVDSYAGYVTAILNTLGRNTVIRLYFKLYDSIHKEFLQHAQKAKLRDLHDGLLQLKPSLNDLIRIQDTFADSVTLQLFKQLNCKRLNTTNVFSQYQHGEQTPAAKVLHTSLQYAKWHMLSQSGLTLEDEEIMPELQHLSEKQLTMLHDTEMAPLPLGYSLK